MTGQDPMGAGFADQIPRRLVDEGKLDSQTEAHPVSAEHTAAWPPQGARWLAFLFAAKRRISSRRVHC